MEWLLCQGVCVVLSSPTVAECGDTVSGPSLQVKGLEVEGIGPSLEPRPVWLQNPTSQPLPCSCAFQWEKKSVAVTRAPWHRGVPPSTLSGLKAPPHCLKHCWYSPGLAALFGNCLCSKSIQACMLSLICRIKKYSKLVNKILKKQTHRYREQASGY